MSNTVLTVEGIKKRFGRILVLDDVKLEVLSGEVHALVGENGAGKSTLMNIISGVHKRDAGRIVLSGEEVDFMSPREACMAGVGFVHQEMALCQHLSVAENVFMWNIPQTKNGNVDFKRLYRETNSLLRDFGTSFDARTIVSTLTVAQQQVVEIVRALSMNAKLIIFDEPTSSLTELETENMFRFIESLRNRGIGIIYISHRLTEIFRICDRATVLRDGKSIVTLDISRTTPDEIVSNMVGRDLGGYYPPKSQSIDDDVLLSVSNVSGDMFKNVSFHLKRGEILGFSGLVGAGRSELMQGICGLRSKSSGRVVLNGTEVPENIPYYKLVKQGLFYLSEDRKKNGLFLHLSTSRNIVVTVLDNITHNGFVKAAEEKQLAEKMIEEMNVKVASLNHPASSMSGGNQQKTMIAKWLVADPKVIIMDEPTRGIDVGSKREIHFKLRALSEQGVGIIVVSSELPEIIGICDRVIVMHDGYITGEVSGEDINEKALATLATAAAEGK